MGREPALELGTISSARACGGAGALAVGQDNPWQMLRGKRGLRGAAPAARRPDPTAGRRRPLRVHAPAAEGPMPSYNSVIGRPECKGGRWEHGRAQPPAGRALQKANSRCRCAKQTLGQLLNRADQLSGCAAEQGCPATLRSGSAHCSVRQWAARLLGAAAALLCLC